MLCARLQEDDSVQAAEMLAERNQADQQMTQPTRRGHRQSSHPSPITHSSLFPAMPLCVHCAYPAKHLYTTYKTKSNIRLAVCVSRVAQFELS